MRALHVIAAVICLSVLISCNTDKVEEGSSNNEQTPSTGGQESVVDDVSEKDIVKIAVGSKDHTTLVAALKAADLVTALANAGPFTVFAPVNAAFEKLPAGTVEELLKPENKGKLQDILQHHVTVSVITEDMFIDGQILGMVDGNNATISKKEDGVYVDGAKIIASVRATNGIVHVVDGVILAKPKSE